MWLFIYRLFIFAIVSFQFGIAHGQPKTSIQAAGGPIVIRPDAVIRRVVFSTNASRIAYGDDSGTLVVHDLVAAQAELEVKIRKTPILGIAFSADESLIACSGPWTGSFNREVIRVPSGEFEELLADYNASPSSNGAVEGSRRPQPHPYVSSGAEKDRPTLGMSVVVVNAANGRLVHEVVGGVSPATDIFFLDQKNFLGWVDGAFDFYTLDLGQKEPQPSRRIRADFDRAFSLEPQPRLVSISDNRHRFASVATGSMEPASSIKLWDVDHRQFRNIKTRGRYPSPRAIAIAPDGKQFATSGRDGRVHLWDFAKGDYVRAFDSPEKKVAGTEFMAFSPDGTQIATGDKDRSFRVWNVAKGQRVLTAQGPTAPVRDVAFVKGKLMVASGGLHTVNQKVDPLFIWDALGPDSSHVP